MIKNTRVFPFVLVVSSAKIFFLVTDNKHLAGKDFSYR